MNEIKHPSIKVKLTGTDGNAFALMGKVKRALANGGVTLEEQKQFITEATSGDYNNLLATCCRWVTTS